MNTSLEKGSLKRGGIASSFSTRLESLCSVIYANALFSKFSFFHKLFILWPWTDLSPLWNASANLSRSPPPPAPPPPPGRLFIKEHGRHTLALLRPALWWQASLTKIKELWSQPWKEKHPQREVQFMSELNLNSSETEQQSGFWIFLLRTIFQITDQINILVTSLNESVPRQQTKPMAHVQCNLEKVFSVFKQFLLLFFSRLNRDMA